jgi:hypothetical protein
MKFSPEVEDAIARAAARYGVPIEAMRAQAQIESGGNPAAQNPSSSAGGLYQFIDSTAKQYGLADKYDPYQSSDAAARLMSDNYKGLSGVLGRAPTTGELYLAHQQGLGGATKLLSNPNAPAASLVGAKAVSLNGGDPRSMSASQFASQWTSKADALANGQGPTVANATAAMQPQGLAALAPAAGAALPTVQETAAADPMSGVFGLLMQQKMQQQPVAIPAAAPMQRPKAVDTRTEEEKLAAVSQTPDVYLERLRRRASYG